MLVAGRLLPIYCYMTIQGGDMSATSTEDEIQYVTTSVRIPAEVWSILRRAALARAEIDGTRLSVSGVLSDLVYANRAALVGPVGQ